jgi:purine-binding chemotaxis protein CheW
MTQVEATKNNQYLTFSMGDEDYAVPVCDVREVLSVPKVTRIPRMPPYLKGVVNLRGSVVPILDLKLKFGLGETAITPATGIIVVEIPYGDGDDGANLLHLGIFADTVKKVITIGDEDIEPSPKIGLRIQTAFITGIGRVDEGFIVILNTREVLTSEDLELADSARSVTAEA